MKNCGTSFGWGLLRRPAGRQGEGFTLVELLVVITVIVILASLLLPVLSKAKESARSINCQSNLRQLQLCWHLYADDAGGVFVPNDWIDSESTAMIVTTNGGTTVTTIVNINQFNTQTSWCPGNARTDTTTSNLQQGLLFQYNTSAAIYHCPSDLSTIQDANGNPLPQLRNRSYNMSQSVNGFPFLIDPASQYLVGAEQPCFAKFSAITNPSPSRLFVFIDENEGTLQDAQFGYPSQGWGTVWWDMPSNRHNQGANLSFADGHTEHWHWKAPMIPPYPSGFAGEPVLPEQLPDWTRVGNAMRQKLFDGLAD